MKYVTIFEDRVIVRKTVLEIPEEPCLSEEEILDGFDNGYYKVCATELDYDSELPCEEGQRLVEY